MTAENDNPYRRRRIVVEVDVHDDDYVNLCETLLNVADLVDPGNVELSAGPASASGKEGLAHLLDDLDSRYGPPDPAMPEEARSPWRGNE